MSVPSVNKAVVDDAAVSWLEDLGYQYGDMQGQTPPEYTAQAGLDKAKLVLGMGKPRGQTTLFDAFRLIFSMPRWA